MASSPSGSDAPAGAMISSPTGSSAPCALDEYQQGALQAMWRSEAASLNVPKDAEGHGDGHGHGHGHGEKAPSLVSAVISAVINFLLMFGLCCAYGMIMFPDETNAQHRGLGVKMNLGTALVCGLLCACFSKVGVCIGGPDLNPVVFLGMFVATISEELAKKHEFMSSRRLQELCSSGEFMSESNYDSLIGDLFVSGGRRLAGACVAAASSAGSSSSDTSTSSRLLAAASPEFTWCVGAHLASYPEECAVYHEELRATVIFAVAVSSVLFAVLFILLGRLKLVKLVTFIPASIMEAFLSCIGYKVFKYALKFCGYQARTFIPAVCIGVPLYFMKALHVGPPAIIIPAMLLVPLGIYYAILYSVYMGGPDDFITAARDDGLFFPIIEDVPFYKIWTDSVFKYYRIDFNAWIASLGDLIIMTIVVLLDCLLKLSSTESKLPVKVDKEWEIQVYGATNFLTAACGSSVGYMQLKFNVINYGVLGNVTDRRAGAIYALLCGVCFFWTVELFNFMPRFFIGVLLFFAGSGFVAENLWGSRKFLSIAEWIQVLGILGTFVLTGQLTYAVVVGGILCGICFIYRYAKVPCLDGLPLRGGDVITSEFYDPFMQSTISHMANSWLLVFNLKGFIFFASAVSLTQSITNLLETQASDGTPEFRRVRYVVFDCKTLDGLDASAMKSLLKLVGTATKMGVKVIWCGASKPLKADLIRTNCLQSDEHYFEDISKAALYVEARIIERAKQLQDLWCQVHPVFREYNAHARARVAFEPFHDMLPDDASRFGTPWAFIGRLKLQQYKTILWSPHQQHREMFLIHTGAVGIFQTLPLKENAKSAGGYFSQPLAVFRHGALLNMAKALKLPTDFYAVALEDGEAVYWSNTEWRRMGREQPFMFEGVMNEVLHQLHIQSNPNKTLAKPESTDSTEAMIRKLEKDDAFVLPLNLYRVIASLRTASGFERFGLYEKAADGEGLLVELPDTVRRSLDVAFYSMLPDGATTLDLPTAREALMYAGIFGVSFNDANVAVKSFSHAQFLALAREAYSMRLSKTQLQKIDDICGGMSEDMTFDAFHKSLQERLNTHVSEDCTLGVANVIVADLERMRLKKNDIVTLMARLLRVHELDWLLLKAIGQVLGDDPFRGAEPVSQKWSSWMNGEASALGAERLLTEGSKLSKDDAEEMIWAASCCNAKSMDVRLIYQVLHTVYRESMPLPPVPRACPASASDTKPEMSESIRELVVDMRNSDPFEALRGYGVASAVDKSDRVAEEAQEATARVRNTGSEKRVADDVFVEYTLDKKAEIPDTAAAKLHLFLDAPESSTAANVWSCSMGILILLSVFTMVLEPLMYEREPNQQAPPSEAVVWFSIEAAFTIIFSAELLVRFLVAPALHDGTTYGSFLQEPMNMCDFVAVAPFYIDLFFGSNSEGFRLLRVLRLTRLARMARLGKLARRSTLFAPTAVVMTVIWFIYLKSRIEC